jgi:hypothetical protein
VQAQASTTKVAEPQLTVFYIEDTKTMLIDTTSLDPKTCIIRVVKDKYLKRSL